MEIVKIISQSKDGKKAQLQVRVGDILVTKHAKKRPDGAYTFWHRIGSRLPYLVALKH